MPEVIVSALLVDEDGRVMLIRSHKWKDKYVVVGGHVEEREAVFDALKREVKEETGFEISGAYFLCPQEFIHGEGFHKKKHFIFLDFWAPVKGKQPTPKLNEEGQSFAWLNPEEALSSGEVEPYTAKALRRYVELKAAGKERAVRFGC